MTFFSSGFGGGGSRGREMRGGGNMMGQQQPGQYINQIPQMAQQQLNPYVQRGDMAYNSPEIDQLMHRALQTTSNYSNNPYGQRENLYENNAPRQFGEMANDPSSFIDQIMRRYTPSEGYKYKQDRMGQAARNSAASGGFAGTQYDQERQADLVRDLLGQDQQQYLENVLGTQQFGLGGLERMLAGREREGQEYRAGNERNQQNLLNSHGNILQNWAQMLGQRNESREKRGYGASSDLANILGSNLGQQELYNYGERRQAREQEQAMRAQEEKRKRNRAQMIGQLAGGGLGAFFGGPAGAQVGSGIGGSIGGIF